MAHRLIFLVSLTLGLASGIPLIVVPESSPPDSEQVQYSLQLVPVPPRTEFGTADPPPPVYLPVQQQVQPTADVQPHSYNQETFPNRITQSHPPPALQQPIHTIGQPTFEIPSQEPLQPLGQLPHQLTTYQPQVQDVPLFTTPAYQNLPPHQAETAHQLPAYQNFPPHQPEASHQPPSYQNFPPHQPEASHKPPAYQHLPPHQVDVGHHQGVHNPPPAPVGSTSAYVATLSYGPGYPTVVYSCYIPGRHPPPTTSSDIILKGNNGYHCAVSYYHSKHEKHPELSDEDFYDKK